MIMCGIDVHDNTLVTRIGINKQKPTTKMVKNTLNGRFQLFKYLKNLSKESNEPKIVAAYEASSIGFCIYDDCISAGIECHVLAPTKMRKSKKDMKQKNDVKDANLILEILKAHLLAGNELPSIWIPDDETRDDRELVRARLNVVVKQTAVKTQIQTLLKRNKVVKDPEIGDAWTKSHRRWLDEIELPLGARAALSSLLRQLENIESEVKILDKGITELSKTKRYKEPAKVLEETIKGVGLLTAMVFLTEMGDLSRFSNRKKVGAFLGLVPSSNESGEKNDRKGHITRAGPSRVRSVLCQATLSRISCDKKEHIYYWKIVDKNPKHKKIAVVACMRRLSILMWHLALDAQQKEDVFNKSA